MRRIIHCGIVLVFCLAAAAVSARESQPALRYHFSLGQTNVYRVEVTVRSESGLSTTSGNVFIIPVEAGTNGFRLSCRGNLDVKNETERSGAMPYFGGNRWQGGVNLPEGTEIQLDAGGRLLRVAGDYPLPLPAGTLLAALFPSLPAATLNSASTAFVVDSPYWIGPSLFIAAGQQSYGPPFFMNYGPRQNLAALGVSNLVTWKITAATATNIILHQSLQLASFLKTGAEPRVAAAGAGDLIFDSRAGLFRQIDAEYTASGNTSSVLRRAKVAFHARLLEGAELASVLNPPPPPPAPSRKLADGELPKLLTDLQSSDVDKRRNAINRLRDVDLDSAPPELLAAVVALGNDDDAGTRQVIVNFLNTYGTSNQVPALIRFLKDADDNNCGIAVKALGRIKDERAIVPLTDVLAGGIHLNQYNQMQNYQLLPDIASALIGFGPAAEKPVLELFQERGIEPRRQACLILKQVGTPASIEVLQKAVADPNSQLSQAAADAIRTIQARQ